MAHTAADGSKWTNASQARRVPGRAQGDGKQPVDSFPKPEAPRAATASPVSATSTDSDSSSQPSVEVTHDGSMFVVTAKFPSEQEANAAAQALQSQDQQQPDMPPNPSQAMM